MGTANDLSGKRALVRLGLSGKQVSVRIRLSGAGYAEECAWEAMATKAWQGARAAGLTLRTTARIRSYLHAASQGLVRRRLQRRTGAISVRCGMARLSVGGVCIASMKDTSAQTTAQAIRAKVSAARGHKASWCARAPVPARKAHNTPAVCAAVSPYRRVTRSAHSGYF